MGRRVAAGCRLGRTEHAVVRVGRKVPQRQSCVDVWGRRPRWQHGRRRSRWISATVRTPNRRVVDRIARIGRKGKLAELRARIIKT